MRAVAFHFVLFVYIFSLSLWMVDEGIFQGSYIRPMSLTGQVLDTEELAIERTEKIRAIANQTLNPTDSGDPLDRITDFTTTGYVTAWTMLDLLTGSYMFAALGLIGLPSYFIIFLQLLFPILVGFTVLYFVLGRY